MIVSLETLLAQAMGKTDPATGAIVPSIIPATTYVRTLDENGYLPGRLYARDESPMFETVEEALTKLEGGAGAFVFSSGMAACATLLLAFPTGSTFAVPRVAFVGLVTLWRDLLPGLGYKVVVYQNESRDDLERVMAEHKPQVLWIETPANPTMEITDLTFARQLCDQYGSHMAVDNTVPTPLVTKPIAFGADWVTHSSTTGLNGHHDVVSGALIGKVASGPMWDKIKLTRKYVGGVPGAFDVWLLLRGMQTLFLRVPAANRNTQMLAEYLETHPKVERVLYPGLPSHPDYATAQRQMTGGFGALLSFCVKGGRAEALDVVRKVKVFKVATSLGGMTSLIEHRATIEGEKSAVPQNLLRVAVGCENGEDLRGDLEDALRG
jgi:cystathionine gamma-synthase